MLLEIEEGHIGRLRRGDHGDTGIIGVWDGRVVDIEATVGGFGVRGTVTVGTTRWWSAFLNHLRRRFLQDRLGGEDDGTRLKSSWTASERVGDWNAPRDPAGQGFHWPGVNGDGRRDGVQMTARVLFLYIVIIVIILFVIVSLLFIAFISEWDAS